MSIRDIAWAWTTKLDPLNKLVLLALADAYPSFDDTQPDNLHSLCRKVSWDYDETVKALRLLESLHYLTRDHWGDLCCNLQPDEYLPRRPHSQLDQVRRQATRNGLRKEIFGRDGYKCLACGETEWLVVDHIIPVINGGTSDQSNLQTLCPPCNGAKGTKTIDYRRVPHGN